MKRILLLLVCTVIYTVTLAQSDKWQIKLRVPIQYEIQKAEISNSLRPQTLKGNAVNFGLDALINRKINKLSVFAGFGLFRNQFNIKRVYDHQALNSADSLPIATGADNYVYSLLRFPHGVAYKMAQFSEITFSIGVEHNLSFSFRRKYNGRLPFQGANTIYKGSTFFGNSFNLLLNFKKKRVEAEPYIRLYNRYRKDRFLNENESEFVSRPIDAFGIALKYQFQL